MDSITQITLGAAVGEAVLGKKVGNKALLWGAVAGTIPDLDVLVSPFFDSVERLVIHRGFSHSLLFSLMLAPLLGYFIYRLYRKKEATWRDWTRLAFWSLFTHPLLDCFTTYGTQLFQPFSDYRVAFNTIFVVDPLYTGPFLISVLIVLVLKRNSKSRRLVNYAGITISSLYLLVTVFNKFYVDTIFDKALKQDASVSVTRFMTVPTPFNNVLWRCVAEDSTGFRIGYYSLFDQNQDIEFHYVEKQYELAHLIQSTRTFKILEWASNGYYFLREENNELYFNDLRFGELMNWRTNEAQCLFSYKINIDQMHPQQPVSIERAMLDIKMDKHLLAMFLERVKGSEVR